MPDTKKRAEEMAVILARLNDEFDQINIQHFGGKLRRPLVEFSVRKSFGGYYQKREHRIVLSWQAYTEYGWDETVNTFRHEIAHIIHLDHSRAFWALAFRLGSTRKYAREPLKRRSHRVLVYECPGCRKRIQRRRKINNSSCARCDKKFNPAYKLRLVEEIKVPSIVPL